MYKRQALYLLLTGNQKYFGLDITAEEAKVWVEDLVSLVQAMEALPEPQMTAELSSVEQFAVKMRKRNPYLELWIGLGIFGFFVAMAAVIFAVVFLFASMDGV